MPSRHAFFAKFTALLPWLGVLAAFSAVWVQHLDSKDVLEAQRELIRVQVALDTVKLFDSTEMRKARRAFAEELLHKKDKTDVSETRVLEFFEDVASYRNQGRIDDATVMNDFSYYVERYWVAAKPFVQTFQKQEKDESFYSGFEGLNEALLKEENKQQPSSDEVKRFLQEEATLTE
jgi:hypothetical protein